VATVLLALHDAGGTVPPMQAIAAELVRRGHEVGVLGQPSVRDRMEAVGATFHPFSTLPDYDHTRPFEDQLELIGPATVGREVGIDLLAHEVDVYVVDCNLAGALSAAESSGTPTIALLHSLRRTYVDIWFGELWPLLAPGITETREHFGLDPVDSWSELFARQARQWSVVPPAFDVDPTPPPANHVHLGWTVPHAEALQLPAAGARPIVLASFSTTAMSDREQIQATLDGLGALSVRGIATIADRVGHHDLRVPGNVDVRDVVPHAALMPSVDVVVTHAGLGTVAVALSHGVPLACMPIERDQPHNASLISELGAGAIVKHPTAGEVAVTVQRILDNAEYRAAAESLRGNDGAIVAADDVERLVANDHA
jgi:UDP:flavonoid glycosyltransferase YjiC (YdhE family)